MTVTRKLLALAAPLALLTAAGCANNFSANVARFQRLPVPQGQTFAVVPANPGDRGGLEFGSYAALVTQRLAAQGYQPASGGTPNMVVRLDYGVGHPNEKVTTTPSGFCGGYGGFGGYGGGFGGWGGGFGGYGGFGGGRFGRYGGFGWAPGFGGYGGGFGCPDVQSYTVYPAFLTMDISRADGTKLFEGRARAQATTDNLTYLVPNLIDAMFTGFPGNSGQDIRITITKDQQKTRPATVPPVNSYAPRATS